MAEIATVPTKAGRGGRRPGAGRPKKLRSELDAFAQIEGELAKFLSRVARIAAQAAWLRENST